MGYFDDLDILRAQIIPHCPVVVDKRFPKSYSVEFSLAGNIYFGIDDGPRQVFSGPHLFWHYSRHTYQYGPAGEDGWHHHFIAIQGTRARRLMEEGFLRLSGRGVLPVRDGRAMAALFRRITELAPVGTEDSHAEAVIALEQILRLGQLEKSEGQAEFPQRRVIDEVVRAISQDPLRSYDFPREAGALHLSYSHFRRLFRMHTGHAPHDYLLLCRMRYAARLIGDTPRQIKEIAQLCGYEDTPAFSRVFRRQMGLSPQQYRATIPALPLPQDPST